MKMRTLRGLWTALITPFHLGNGNAIDYDSLERILKLQIESGVDGVLLLGTTGEKPTLTEAEKMKLIDFSVKILKGKTKIMVNAGTYSTQESIENIRYLNTIDGIDAYLVVTPYYNKPTQTGLKKHFMAIAQATKKPIILYNVPGRTGVNLETKTLLDVTNECGNIVGIKEASGNKHQIQNIIKGLPKDFLVFAGDDSLAYDVIKSGGDGLISVASNCLPREMNDFVHKCLDNDIECQKLNTYYQPFFHKLFTQTNPLPVKTYLAHKGIIQESFRLPLCPMDRDEKTHFLETVQEYFSDLS